MHKIKQWLRSWLDMPTERCACGLIKPQGMQSCGVCFSREIVNIVADTVARINNPPTPPTLDPVPTVLTPTPPEQYSNTSFFGNYTTLQPSSWEVSYYTSGFITTTGDVGAFNVGPPIQSNRTGSLTISGAVYSTPEPDTTAPPEDVIITNPNNRTIRI